MMADRLLAFGAGSLAALVSILFMALDSRTCKRGHYTERFGRRASSLWVFPEMLFLFLAIILFRISFGYPPLP